MATRAIICNVCGFRLDGRVKGFPDKIEWTHSDRECQDFLRERNAELVTALEALLAFDADYPILEDLRAYNAARDAARDLLAGRKAP